MTDYHPLIARAVEGLDKSTGEARRALYERARTALVTQLRGVEPALSESEITKERLALEEAIRKVEAEAARKSRTEPRVEQRAEPPKARSVLAQALPAAREAGTPAPVPGAGGPRRTDSARAKQNVDQPGQAEGARRSGPSARERLLSGRTAAHVQERARAQSLKQERIKDFRDAVGEVHDLGAATAKAVQSARELRESYTPRAPQDATSVEEPDVAPSRGRLGPPLDAEEVDAAAYGPQHWRGLEAPEEVEDEQPAAPSSVRPLPPPAEEEFHEKRPPRSYRGLVTGMLVLLMVAGVAAATWWQWPRIIELTQLLPQIGAKQQSQPARETPAAQPKFSGRVPQEQAPAPAPSTTAPAVQPPPAVAQRVVLYEEDTNDPQGKRFVGSAVWRTETVSPGAGLAPELAVRADIEIPERKISVTWSLRRNSDKALPASHTIEIMFTLPADFPGGGIANVPGILMKQAEQARGTPLAGLAVKVTNGFFLIGLSATEADVQRNIQLLKERSWFDIPVVYTNGGRAILAMEKGPPGDHAFTEAFAAWEKK